MIDIINNFNKKLNIMKNNPDIRRLIYTYDKISYCSILDVKNSHYEVEIWHYKSMETLEKFNIKYTHERAFKKGIVYNKISEVKKL